jgi:opacity protein-like surface antigen
MRLLLLMTIFSFLSSWQICTAQDDDIPELDNKLFEGRLILGTNFAQVDGDSYTGFHKQGINAGGMVYVHLSQATGVSMEMLYSQKGTRGATVKESYYVGTYFDKYFLDLKYAEVPILFHMKKIIAFFDFEGGISYSRLLSDEERGEADVPVQILPEYNYFNKVDISWIAGVTLRLSKHWYGNVRYQYSMVPIRPWERVPLRYNMNSGQFNEAVAFRIMYRL